jgi:SulP family sulfate permease
MAEEPGASASSAQATANEPLTRDALAGLITATVLIAYAMSYSALILPGELAAGVPRLLWAILIGGAIVGAAIARWTTIPPLCGGMDAPQTAVTIVLAAMVAEAARRTGADNDAVILHIMLALTMTSFIFGLLTFLIGWFRVAGYLKIIPYAVVAGFLTATGGLLIIGGFRLATGLSISRATFTNALPAATQPRLVAAVAFASLLFVLSRVLKGPFTIPGAVVGASIIADAALIWWNGSLAASTGWFLVGLDQATPWQPIPALFGHGVNFGLLAGFLPDALAISAVGVISLLLKYAGIESQRATSVSLDREFRVTGAANVVGSAVGGMSTSVVLAATRLLSDAGGRSFFSGVFAAAAIGVVAVFKINIPAVVPVPVLGGLVMFLGSAMVLDVIKQMASLRDWANLLFATVVALVCLAFGYIAGVFMGIAGACLLFALSYSRVGLVRRQATSASYASDVDHGPEAMRVLRREGDAIQIYWLAGYMYFGSADVIFERVRTATLALTKSKARYIVLDFSGVTGADVTAVMGLVKLRNFADRNGISLFFCALDSRLLQSLEAQNFFRESSRHRRFLTRLEGMEWAEFRLLDELKKSPQSEKSSAEAEEHFMKWILSELGPRAQAEQFANYFERRSLVSPCVLYEQNSPADQIDLVVSGTVTISFTDATGRTNRLRRMLHRTVVGEMGFFRSGTRSAAVTVDGPTVIYSLSRASFDRMRMSDPALANAFLGFIVRTLAERLEFANRQISEQV